MEAKKEVKKETAKKVVETEKEQKLKSSYEVAVTGFYSLGKMFRAGEKIKTSIYEKHIPRWLKEGKIR